MAYYGKDRCEARVWSDWDYGHQCSRQWKTEIVKTVFHPLLREERPRKVKVCGQHAKAKYDIFIHQPDTARTYHDAGDSVRRQLDRIVRLRRELAQESAEYVKAIKRRERARTAILNDPAWVVDDNPA